MSSRSSTQLLVWAIACCAAWGACSAPVLVPIAPLATQHHTDGVEHTYDLTGNGQPDYAEIRGAGAEGRVRILQWSTDKDGRLEESAILNDIATSDCRQLLIILDSIPHALMNELWSHGRFRYFARPSRLLAPFPVMTDLSLAEFFDVSPCPGVESAYYDGQRLTDPYTVYPRGDNAPWLAELDWALDPAEHWPCYLWPRTALSDELAKLQRAFWNADEQSSFKTYVVSTSAMGAKYGRSGHVDALAMLDRMCQALMLHARGRLHITLLSDHGQNHREGRRLKVSDVMRDLGYRVVSRLQNPGDVVVPAFSIVTYAGVYTARPAQLAADAVMADGINLAVYRDVDRDGVVVLDRAGRARITHQDSGFRYTTEWGDPLRLNPLLDDLRAAGAIRPDGFIDDRVLFDATAEHIFPDALHRLWRAFHGLTVHPPDVLLSLDEDRYCGSGFMASMITLRAAHGALHKESSIGFVMSTAGALPSSLRMRDVLGALGNIGLQGHPPR